MSENENAVFCDVCHRFIHEWTDQTPLGEEFSRDAVIANHPELAAELPVHYQVFCETCFNTIGTIFRTPLRPFTEAEQIVGMIRRHVTVVALTELAPQIQWDEQDGDIIVNRFTVINDPEDRQYFWDGRMIRRKELVSRARDEIECEGFVPTEIERQVAYINAHGAICPYCGSDKLDWGTSEITDTGYVQDVTCETCQHQWTDLQSADCVGYKKHKTLFFL